MSLSLAKYWSKYWALALVILALAILVIAGLRQPISESVSYPEKPINVFIGFAAGGSQDLAGRALAKELQKILGQPVAVVNQPGAASMVSAHNVANSRPDGYSIWFGSAGTLVLKSELEHTQVDFFENFELLGLTGKVVPAIGVPVDSPFNSIQDIIDAAHAKPGELRWSHNGRGAAFMAMGTSFIEVNDLDVVGVPFQGAKAMRLALFANQVDFGLLSEGDRLMFGEKKMKVLASMRQSREGIVDADLPTLGELGIPFVEIHSPIGMMVPKGTPEHVVTTLRNAIAEAAASEDFQKTMARLYIPYLYMNAGDGTKFVAEIHDNVQQLLPALSAEGNSESVAADSLMAPRAVGLFLLVLLIYQVIVYFRSVKTNKAAGNKTADIETNQSGEAAVENIFDLQLFLRSSGPLLLLLCIYGLFHGWFGYLIATALSGYAVFALFGNRLNKVLLHGSIGAIIFYFLFVNLLNVYDPPGTLLDVSNVFR